MVPILAEALSFIESGFLDVHEWCFSKKIVHGLCFAIMTFYLFFFSEYMSGGSVYDFLHKQKGVFKLPSLLKVAIDVSKGMSYLHQNSIIHRDLKAANLLMDENEVMSSLPFYRD